MDSKFLYEFNQRISGIVKGTKIEGEEIKWQKVNALTLPVYIIVVDELFKMLEEGKAKIRIFFRHNRHKMTHGFTECKNEEYTKLYYQFIKHAFGFTEAPKDGDNRLRLLIDEMPIKNDQRNAFVSFLYGLKNFKGFKRSNTFIIPHGISEVNSKRHLPLQVMDLVMGAMCFRLNNKHLIKDPVTGKRPHRTVCKEKLYKHIYSRIAKLRPNFNIGVSTGINAISDHWNHPYRHWSFVPYSSTITDEFNKH